MNRCSEAGVNKWAEPSGRTQTLRCRHLPLPGGFRSGEVWNASIFCPSQRKEEPEKLDLSPQLQRSHIPQLVQIAIYRHTQCHRTWERLAGVEAATSGNGHFCLTGMFFPQSRKRLMCQLPPISLLTKTRSMTLIFGLSGHERLDSPGAAKRCTMPEGGLSQRVPSQDKKRHRGPKGKAAVPLGRIDSYRCLGQSFKNPMIAELGGLLEYSLCAG